jgi:AcrR family transcriptional regulator
VIPTAAPGRRERKKALTRSQISDAATRLFLERGFDGVTVKEIADAADVSPTTVFKHFPTKEALVFDEDAEQQARLVAAVRDRTTGQGVIDAVEAHLLAERLTRGDDPRLRAFVAMVERTPSLRDYERAMAERHAEALAAAIVETVDGAGVLRARALARFLLDALDLCRGEADRSAALVESIAILRRGWSEAAG